jgi:hypothetical protein
MAKEGKKTKSEPAPKKEAPPATDKSTTEAAPAKSEGSEKSGAAPANYSRGEGQKLVTQAYRDNWNDIFRKKKKR